MADVGGAPARAQVLYIGGYSRSGSTILMRVLSSAEGVVAVGELVNIWSRGYLENQLCGCGSVFLECPFWNQVSLAVFGSPSSGVPAERIHRLQCSVHQYSAFPQLWAPALRTEGYRARFAEYADVVTRLYRAILDESGCRVVADSSKVPQFARMLREVPGVDMSLIHLVRDSRATAFSWQRSKVRPEIHWTHKEMERYSPLRSSFEWDVFNALLGLEKGRGSRYTLVRYEDFAHGPRRLLADLARNLDQPELARAAEGEGDEVALEVSHTVSGNPGRFSAGRTKISADEEWMRAMPVKQRKLVTWATAPLLRRYGYPLAPTAASPQ